MNKLSMESRKVAIEILTSGISKKRWNVNEMHSEVVEEIPYHRFNTKYKKNLDSLAKLLKEKKDYSRNYVRRIR